MGLDMYAFTQKAKPQTPVDFEPDTPTELHYWRKHPNLHGWMEALYFEKGGQQSFNCVPVELTIEDLDRLEADLSLSNLPQTEGFFFGQTQGDELDDDLTFIAKARAAIANGLTVYYDSWW